MARHRTPDPIDDGRASAAPAASIRQNAPAHGPRHQRAEFAPSRFAIESDARYSVDSARVGHPTSVESATQYALAVPGSTAENMPSLSSGPDPAGVGAGEVPHDDTEMSAIEGGSRRNRRGIHRRRVPKPGGRAIAASVAVGAFLSAAASSPNAGSDEAVALSAASIDQPPGVVPPSPTVAAPPQILQLPDLDVGRLAQQWTEQLAEGRARAAERAARDAEARRPLSAVPVSGTLTSNYGARWGTTHYGLDIANTIGTPIVSVTDGEVIEAGPAQGFGLWVRIRQDDGTIGVYGHIDQALVTAGQRVKAGELIATVGNRGQSTGPHLHYEVWQSDGAKSDPTAWLSARGIDIT